MELDTKPVNTAPRKQTHTNCSYCDGRGSVAAMVKGEMTIIKCGKCSCGSGDSSDNQQSLQTK